MKGFHERLEGMPPDKRLYMLQFLPTHLKEGEQSERLHQILANFDFIEAKVSGLGSQPLLNELINDYDLIDYENPLQLIQGTLRLSAHVLAQDTTQLAGQFLGRLLSYEMSEVRADTVG